MQRTSAIVASYYRHICLPVHSLFYSVSSIQVLLPEIPSFLANHPYNVPCNRCPCLSHRHTKQYNEHARSCEQHRFSIRRIQRLELLLFGFHRLPAANLGRFLLEEALAILQRLPPQPRRILCGLQYTTWRYIGPHSTRKPGRWVCFAEIDRSPYQALQVERLRQSRQYGLKYLRLIGFDL